MGNSLCVEDISWKFVGRDRDIEELLNIVRTARQVCITGMRKMGKTRVMNKLLKELEKNENTKCVFVDLENFRLMKINEIFNMCRDLLKALQNDEENIQFTLQNDIADQIKEFQRHLNSVCKETKNRLIIFLLDNLDNLMRSELRDNLLSFIQNTIQKCGNVKFIMAQTVRAKSTIRGYVEYRLKPIIDDDLLELLFDIVERDNTSSQSDLTLQFSDNMKVFKPENKACLLAIIKLCEGLPVAAAVSGTLLKEDGGLLTPADLVFILLCKRLTCLSPENFPPDERIAQYKDELDKLDDVFKDILDKLVVRMEGSDFGVKQAQEAAGNVTEADVKFEFLKKALDNCLMSLNNMSGDKQFHLHGVFQECQALLFITDGLSNDERYKQMVLKFTKENMKRIGLSPQDDILNDPKLLEQVIRSWKFTGERIDNPDDAISDTQETEKNIEKEVRQVRYFAYNKEGELKVQFGGVSITSEKETPVTYASDISEFTSSSGRSELTSCFGKCKLTPSSCSSELTPSSSNGKTSSSSSSELTSFSRNGELMSASCNKAMTSAYGSHELISSVGKGELTFLKSTVNDKGIHEHHKQHQTMSSKIQTNESNTKVTEIALPLHYFESANKTNGHSCHFTKQNQSYHHNLQDASEEHLQRSYNSSVPISPTVTVQPMESYGCPDTSQRPTITNNTRMTNSDLSSDRLPSNQTLIQNQNSASGQLDTCFTKAMVPSLAACKTSNTTKHAMAGPQSSGPNSAQSAQFPDTAHEKTSPVLELFTPRGQENTQTHNIYTNPTQTYIPHHVPIQEEETLVAGEQHIHNLHYDRSTRDGLYNINTTYDRNQQTGSISPQGAPRQYGYPAYVPRSFDGTEFANQSNPRTYDEGGLHPSGPVAEQLTHTHYRLLPDRHRMQQATSVPQPFRHQRNQWGLNSSSAIPPDPVRWQTDIPHQVRNELPTNEFSVVGPPAMYYIPPDDP